MTFMVDNKEQLPAPTEGGPVQILIGPENLSEAPAGQQRGGGQL